VTIAAGGSDSGVANSGDQCMRLHSRTLEALSRELPTDESMKPTSTKHASAGDQLKVFISTRASTCDECGQSLGRSAWIVLAGERGAACLSCADLDHLVFLPSGDTALTRRARRYSTLAAVVLKWSSTRKRYERQGLLVEEAGLAKAEAECLTDGDARARRAQRDALLRAEQDHAYVGAFAQRVRVLFPQCPAGREQTIAEHACLKYSGRVGRSADARNLDDEAIRLAVVAHVRHAETGYDALIAAGHSRHEARRLIEAQVRGVLAAWGPT